MKNKPNYSSIGSESKISSKAGAANRTAKANTNPVPYPKKETADVRK
jgi:hypothetical protein